MILCLGTTPAAQRVMIFPQLLLDAVNRAVTTLDGAAGKSINVAKVLKTLGEEPIVISFLGGDRGDEVRALLQAQGIELEFIGVPARTRQCITVIDESAGTQTELVEESQPVAAEHYDKLATVIRERVKGCRAAIMSGTITPGGPEHFYFQSTQLAREAGALTVVDAKGPLLLEALKARPSIVKPNQKELALTAGQEFADEACVMQPCDSCMSAALRESSSRLEKLQRWPLMDGTSGESTLLGSAQ